MQLTIISGNYYLLEQHTGDSPHYSMVSKYYQQPTGIFPEEIDKIYSSAIWQIGSTYNECSIAVLFDFSNIPGIETPDNIRVLKRTNGFGVNWIDSEAQIVNYVPLQMEFSGYDIMGEYCIASVGGNNLEMNKPLNIIITYNSNPEESVAVTWQLVSEALYYNIFSSDNPYGNWEFLNQVEHPNSSYTIPVNVRQKFFYVTSTNEQNAVK